MSSYSLAKCPTPANLEVAFKEHSLIVSWQHPHLVWKSYVAYYDLVQNVTPVLTGKVRSDTGRGKATAPCAFSY